MERIFCPNPFWDISLKPQSPSVPGRCLPNKPCHTCLRDFPWRASWNKNLQKRLLSVFWDIIPKKWLRYVSGKNARRDVSSFFGERHVLKDMFHIFLAAICEQNIVQIFFDEYMRHTSHICQKINPKRLVPQSVIIRPRIVRNISKIVLSNFSGQRLLGVENTWKNWELAQKYVGDKIWKRISKILRTHHLGIWTVCFKPKFKGIFSELFLG